MYHKNHHQRKITLHKIHNNSKSHKKSKSVINAIDWLCDLNLAEKICFYILMQEKKRQVMIGKTKTSYDWLNH